MRRGRRGTATGGFPGMDSFMDLVTNLLGAVIFVLVYATLASFGATGVVTSPLVSEGETDPAFFECRKDTVLFPGFEDLLDQLKDESQRMEAEGVRDLYAMKARLDQARISNAYYELWSAVQDYGFYRRLDWKFAPVAGGLGEGASELQGEGCVFRQRLKTLDPSLRHVFFIVRSDSFEVFHEARRIAVDAGFRVGWEPWDLDAPVGFSSGGTTPNPQ